MVLDCLPVSLRHVRLRKPHLEPRDNAQLVIELDRQIRGPQRQIRSKPIRQIPHSDVILPRRDEALGARLSGTPE